MFTLGINAAFHDTSACLVHDGKIIAAAEEERFTRIKHGKRPTPFSTYELPFHAINYCLSEAGLQLSNIDHVAYSYDPSSRLGRHTNNEFIELPLEPSSHAVSTDWEHAWDPLFLSSIVNAPRHLIGGIPHHIQKRLRVSDGDRKYKWHFVEHHLSHAASAFYPSPFEHAAVMTLDGRGESTTTNYVMGNGTRMDLLGQVFMPNSLGLLYEQITTYLGFLHSSDEYKVMALASYGKPVYAGVFREAIEMQDHGQYVIKPLPLEQVFGPARSRGAELKQRHFDIASSLQVVLEETVLHLAHWLKEKTRSENLALAGGVALNCVMNARLRDAGPFKRIWVQPAAGDAGTALGAALWIDLKERDTPQRPESMHHAYLGPAYSDEEIEAFLKWSKLPYRRLTNLPEQIADLLAEDKIIGWYQGRMEFGPRALGGRSILASPLNPAMQARLNDIKDREDFRPVAPVVTEDSANKWFKDAIPSPFMLFTNEVLSHAFDKIPAVRHVDGTARIQTVRRDQNPLYYDLLKAFEARTGVPILVNTSFNTRGEPVVCSPRDAVECFWTSPLDALVIGSFLLEKSTGTP